MKVLIVANFNSGSFSPFVLEQAASLKKNGVKIEFYGIKGKGMWGYLKNIKGIKNKRQEFKPDIIHAHYGLSGLCANLQRKAPVITTYHGSDIHKGGWVFKLSQLCMRLSAFNIFVSQKLFEMSQYKYKNSCIQSCGINLEIITSIPKQIARERLGLNPEEKIGLFSGSFSNPIKNYTLANEAIKLIPKLRLIELKGFSREEVNLYMNACDFQLTTSIQESGPLVVKEAMACGTPIVSVDVGDVKYIIGSTEGCYIADRDPQDIAAKILKAIAYQKKTNGRQRIIDLGLDNNVVAENIIKIYKKVLGIL